MKTNFLIFYSWQSDLPSSKNRNLIESCIKGALKVIKRPKNENIELEINIERDTLNRSGSPNIAETIFDKISKADIFIGDVTIINSGLISTFARQRLTPNPNVLIELGYAIHLLGWERIITINNLKFSKNEQLPFDLRGHRMSNYNSSDRACRQKLTGIMKDAISTVITDYDNIVRRHNDNKFNSHDREIYEAINGICDETNLMDGLSMVVNSLFMNDYYYKKWDGLEQYYKKVANHFIDVDLHASYSSFLKNLIQFSLHVMKYFHRVDKAHHLSTIDSEGNKREMTKEELFDTLQDVTYVPHKEPFHNETWNEADKRIYKLQDELYELKVNAEKSYTEFIMTIKKKL